MSELDRLDPLVEYHVANSLGWPRLRPIQELCIGPIQRGENVLIQAQTAGGKTEAALLPVLSRVVRERYPPLSVLYVCPLRALLNNQIERLERLFGMVGHRAGLWHGDVTATRKKQLLLDPPTGLLTTPESLEAILTSQTLRGDRILSQVRTVVIDEVHAFAESDRGWHLLAILSRLEHLAGHPIQRIGLSATVGNPEEIARWMDGRGRQPAVLRTSGTPVSPDVQLDHVGSLGNAATVIHRLHAGEKRLVFCDSRSRVEELASSLRALGTKAFVIHGSLSRDERAATERAFAEEKNCVIVATSALELGIDIGDLDRVIQIDSPGRVASFLQRMGRTGRRPGTSPNCLFLATGDEELLLAAGLIRLWETGFVEKAVPPPRPWHLLAQQVMALALQNRGISRFDVPPWLAASPELLEPGVLSDIVSYALSQGIYSENDGLLWLGLEGERTYGRKNFLALLSVFLSEPQLKVFHGRQELGQVDQGLFLLQRDVAAKRGAGDLVLTLGGRHWEVASVQLKQKTIQVIPASRIGRSQWLGSGRPLEFALMQSVRQVLMDPEDSPRWSGRARSGLARLRGEAGLFHASEVRIDVMGPECLFWTHAGHRANLVLAQCLEQSGFGQTRADGTCVRTAWSGSESDRQLALDLVLTRLKEMPSLDVSPQSLADLKFVECLPEDLAVSIVQARESDPDAVRWVAGVSWRTVRVGG